MRIFLLFFVFASIVFSSFAQRIRYEDQSNLFFGLNAGNTWHTSDVENIDIGLRGAGFIFGASFNHDYHHTISFDLRFRYLGGRWYGQDTDTTGAIANNFALNQAYSDLGYAVQNFRASQHRAAIELALHLNSLRQRTGLDPYIFGGIGYTWSRVKGDLFDEFNMPYDYEQFPSGDIANGDFETSLDMNAAGVPYPVFGDVESWRAQVLPSLGFGLGYYFTSRFSMGFEHKSTFFRGDYFDGTVVDQDGVNDGINDIYHYTSIYARWYLKWAKHSDEEVVENEVNEPWIEETPIQHDPPRVVFTIPSSSPRTVTVSSVTLRGKLTNVYSSQDVLFRQEGEINSNYTYNATSGVFQSTVDLQPGQNVFRLRGSNDYGSDEATMIIIYEHEETPTPPVVTITDPSIDPHVTSVSSHTVRATIKNVNNRSNVAVTVNGQGVNNFDFTPAGINNCILLVNLIPGPNTVRITGTNTYGTATDEVTIIYRRTIQEPTQQPPVVSYSNPIHTSTTVSQPNFTLVGSVLHVDNRNQVTFIQNGSSNGNFTYNVSTKQFRSNVILQPGANIFQLIGTNAVGTDQKQVIINYDEPAPTPPIVTITRPAYQPYNTESENFNFKARVLNVDQKNQITVRVNGGPITNFTYTHNTKEVYASLTLSEGQNTVQISATNEDGSDSKSTVIIYRKPTVELPPLVTYIIPETSPVTTDEEVIAISASVEHVDQKSQIFITVNGASISNFQFNAQTKIVNLTSALVEGANTITITGTNNVGSDSKSTVIIYKKRDVGIPPIVTYLDPVANPKTVYEGFYAIKARVQHVDDKADIELRINGIISEDFNYVPSSETVSFTTSLNEGANSISILATNEVGSDIESTTIIFKKLQPILPPVVTINVPVTDGYESATPTTPLVATVLNVDDVNQIKVFVNGVQNYSFDFNFNTKQLTLETPLNEGENNVKVTGTNQYGSDYDTRMIRYTPEVVVNPPFVEIIQPSIAGETVSTITYPFIATVDNVSSKAEITVVFNGQEVNPEFFTFNLATKEVRFTTDLINGVNNLTVKGTNSAGSHQATTSISYVLPEPECEDPIISFTDPVQGISNVTADSYLISAVIRNIDEVQEIKLTVNGQLLGNFNYNSSTETLTRRVNLSEGNNVVEITVQTDCGKASMSRIIHYTAPAAPCEAPEIVILQPALTQLAVQSHEVEFSATVSNVEHMNQLKVYVNNTPVEFSFDMGTHVVQATLPLVEGENKVLITADNTCKTAQESVTLTRVSCLVPTTDLKLQPTPVNGKTNEQRIIVSGVITEVISTSVTVSVNGVNVNHVYNELQQNFSSEIELNEGENKIVVKAFNRCGSTKEEFVVIYTPVEVVEKPTVNIISPSAYPFETEAASTTVMAKVTNVAQASQIGVLVNQANRNFQFNASTGTVSFSIDLQEGNNSVVITAVNDAGNASDQTVITYVKPVTVVPPVVNFTSPAEASVTYEDGSYVIQGEAAHLTGPNQLELFINNQLITDYTVRTAGNKLLFTIPLEVSLSHNSYTIRAKGTNEAGSDQAMLSVRRVKKEIADRVPGQRPGNNITTSDNVPCDAPTVSLLSATSVDDDSYNLRLKVNHVDGNNVSIKLNGQTLNCSYNQSRKEFSCYVDLKDGNNTFSVKAEGCSVTTEEFTVNYTPICNPIVHRLVYPSSNTITVEESVLTLNMRVRHVTSSGVQATLNGRDVPVLLSGINLILKDLNLNVGNNAVQLKLKNECSEETINFTINYKESICGPYINLGSADWEFCMSTPSGTFTRSSINNRPTFTYSGAASSVYFKAASGGQDVRVNGQNYAVRSGVYYHFEGNLDVKLKWENSRWMLCLEADNAPKSGTGSSRPKSPCEPAIKTPKSPIITPKPSTEDKPTTQPKPAEPRTMPTRNGGIVSPTPSQMDAPEDVKPATPRSIRRVGGN